MITLQGLFLGFMIGAFITALVLLLIIKKLK